MTHNPGQKKKSPDLFSEVLPDANETDQGHSKKLSRYGAAKQHQKDVAEYIVTNEPTLIKEYEALQDCGTWLIFRHWYTVGQYRLIAGCSCKKHLLCGLCALRRAARLVKEYEKKIRQVMAELNAVPVLITRTIRNGEDLKERYEHLSQAHKKMIQARRSSMKNKRLKSKSILRFSHGGAGSFEFKKGEGSGEWHPHIHEVALLDQSFEFIDLIRKGKAVSVPLDFENKLSMEWLKTTGDSWVVDVRKIDTEDDENFIKAICEAFKYALKFNSLEIPEQVEAYKILRGRRLTYSYGCLWGVKIPDESIDTIEEEFELLPYVDLVYKYFGGKYNHTETTDLGRIEKKADTDPEQQKRNRTRSKVQEFRGFDMSYVRDWVAKQELEPQERPKCPF